MTRGCCGASGCLVGAARTVVGSPLYGCCCRKKKQRRFLEYFSRFRQVELTTTEQGQAVQPNRSESMNGTSASPRNKGKRANLRLLVCTANLGNQQPDAESIAKWIPPDGFFVEDTMVTDGEEPESQGADETESSAAPYETKYPIRFDSATAGLLNDDMLMTDSLSKQLDLIVVGLQEATFDPPKEEEENGTSVRIRVPQVKTFKKLKTLRAEKNHLASASDIPLPKQLSDVMSPSNAVGSIRTVLHSINRDNWEDGTHVLHHLFEGRLPSYARLVSYQRGQMRLLVFGRTRSSDFSVDPPIPLKVLHTAAQNTGRAGLANKGGIVTEVLADSSTRLSFVSCHLEAHEGESKYAVRCQTMAEILRGTASRKKVKPTILKNDDEDISNSAHHVTPSEHASQHAYSNMAVDVSLTAHYSFVLGDLNFRTDMSYEMPGLKDEEDAHKRAVQNLVAERDWERLNAADELHMALRQKDCLVGFRTLICNFPPTFKVERQAGYQYIEKRRPSYTDRILFKTGHQLDKGLQPILYEPIDDFTSSDHKPIRAAFAVDLNQQFRVRPRAVRYPSIKWDHAREVEEDEVGRRRRTVESRFRLLSCCRNDSDEGVSSNAVVMDISSGQGLGRTGGNLQLFVSNISISLKKVEPSSHGAAISPTIPPNPYLMLMSQPEQTIRLSYRRAGRLRRFIRRLRTGPPKSTTERTKHGWPCTSRKSGVYAASWGEEEIACKVVTHTSQGGSLDLTGAVLFLSVMNGRTVLNGGEDDVLMGTVTFNLANLVRSSMGITNISPGSGREISKTSMDQPLCHRRRVRRSSLFGNLAVGSRRSAHANHERTSGNGFFRRSGRSNFDDDDYAEDPIVAVEINEPLLKDGVEVGVLCCTIESWWMDEGTAQIVKVPDPEPAAGARNTGFFRRKPKHRKAEKRAGFRETPRGTIPYVLEGSGDPDNQRARDSSTLRRE